MSKVMSKINIENETYEIKDEYARNSIDTLNGTTNDLSNQVEVERQRINKFTSLDEGSTTGDAELQDIRVASDGTTYDSAGDSVRGQSTQLQKEIDSYKDNQLINVFNKETLNYGYGYTGETSETVESDGSFISDYIGCKKGDNLTGIVRGIDLFTYINDQVIKIVEYDEGKNWVKTSNLFQKEISSFIISTTGYFRFQFSSNLTSISDFINEGLETSVYLSSVKKLDIDKTSLSDLTEIPANLNRLTSKDKKSKRFINYLVREECEYGKAYNMSTSNIIDADNYVLSNFIPCEPGDELHINIDGWDLEDYITEGHTVKVIEFDETKNWINTIKNPMEYVAKHKGYIKVNFQNTYVTALDILINTAVIYEIGFINKYLKENMIDKSNNSVDLFMFMGQSNMGGRGVTSTDHPEAAPFIIDGAGYEYRAITQPSKLYRIKEPFGVGENDTSGINDGDLKTGSLVTAFANNYYLKTGVPIIGVSASKGGSSISEWQPEGSYLTDAITRLNNCISYLETKGYKIRHKFMVWCQGETDGDNNTSKSDYITGFENMLNEMMLNGIEKCFMIRIGNCNIEGSESRYTNMIQYQNEIAQNNKNVVMVSTDFAGMKEKGLMKDNFHYYQEGYNIAGKNAGINTAYYVNTGKEPTMYDSEDGSLYYSHKN